MDAAVIVDVVVVVRSGCGDSFSNMRNNDRAGIEDRVVDGRSGDGRVDGIIGRVS